MAAPLYLRSPYVYVFFAVALVLASREVLVRRYLHDATPAADDTGSFVVLWGATAVGTATALLVPFSGVGTVPAPRLAFWLGIGIVLAGFLLRLGAILTLGELFSHRVVVTADHEIVESGPYRWVRHPAYTGAIVTYVGIGVVPGNWLSIVAATGGAVVGYVYRVRVEERVLRRELDGYEAYAERTPYRLIPFVY